MATELLSLSGNTGSATAAHAASDDAERPLDFDLLVRRCMGRIELAQRLLASFDDRFPKELEQLDQCLGAGDVERLTRLAHQLKGTAANISAPALIEIAAKMEESARARKLDDVAARITAIRAAWGRFQEYKATLPCTPGLTERRPAGN